MKKQPLAAIENNFLNKDIVSMAQFDRTSFETVFKHAEDLKKLIKTERFSSHLEKILAALLFFEPSSRTYGSFASAVKRLGGQTLDYSNAASTSSTVKGETLEDMGRVIENYVDVIVMRHPEIGSVEKVARAVNIPVINAGDGAGEHPTQAVMDLFTIKERFGTLDGIKGLFAGDMLYGRTVHSILKGLCNFEKVTLYVLSPKELKLDPAFVRELQDKNLMIVEIDSEKNIPDDCNFWYWTRVQKERFESMEVYESVKNKFIITPTLLKEKGNNDMIIMHPLPRVGEIDERIDEDPRAVYLNKQIENGMYARMALLSLVLGRI